MEGAPQLRREGAGCGGRGESRRGLEDGDSVYSRPLSTTQWSSFLECDARPDPASEPSLRMFLAEMDEADAADEEDMILGRGDAIGGCLRRVERVDEVTRLVEEQLAVATEEGDASAVRQAESFLRGLRSSNLQRLDRLSAWVLEVSEGPRRQGRGSGGTGEECNQDLRVLFGMCSIEESSSRRRGRISGRCAL